MEHTEKVIEEMLENLLQSDDDVESFDEAATVQAANSDDLNGTDKSCIQDDDVEQIYGEIGNAFEQLDSSVKPSSAHNLTIAEELRKMREEYPMSADSEETLTTPSTIALKTASIESGGGGDLSPKTSSSKISYDAEQIVYRNEVSRVLFAGKTENCPAENTPEYYAAAQEYAIYGNDFMDFLPDFEQVYTQLKTQKEDGSQQQQQQQSGKVHAASAPPLDIITAITPTSETLFEDARASSKMPKSRFDFANRAIDSNGAAMNDVNSSEQQAEQTIYAGCISGNKNSNNNNNNNNNNFHCFQQRAAAAAIVAQQQKPLSAVATAGAATAATYYQLCSNLQRPASTAANATPTFNTASTTAAVNANMLLNNNPMAHASNVQTYQSPVFQHQQLSNASNLNQAAYNVAASNVRFASNAPLLPLATATPATNAVNVSAVNVYERMVYAQLLQQQLIKTRQQQLQQQQQQQAIAAATIFQQQLQRQQQLKMAAALQHVAHVTNTNVASSGGGVDLTANVNMQRSSPNQQVVNFSATLTSSQSRSKPTAGTFNHSNFNNNNSNNNNTNTREGNSGQN